MFTYSEHDKVKSVQEESQAIGEFIQWLREQRLVIVEWSEYAGLMPVHKSIEQWLAEYYQINLIKLEEENQQILTAIRENNNVCL